MKAYAGYIKTDELMKSASGGVASLLTQIVVEDNGVVFAVKYDRDYKKALYGEIRDIQDIDCYRDSKYFQKENIIEYKGQKIKIYERIQEVLAEGKLVLFIGLGCDIFALECYLKKHNCNTDNLIKVELICDGVIPARVHKEYIEYLEKKYCSKVVEFSVRDKKYGWGNSCMHVKFENQSEFNAEFYNTQYGRAFRDYKCRRCYSCKFKSSDKHMGDLVIGDYWGCRPGMKVYNFNGVSVVLSNTQKGELLLERLNTCGLYMDSIELEYVYYNQPRLISSHPLNEELWKTIDIQLNKNEIINSFEIIDENNLPQRFKNKKFEKLVVWGIGSCFERNINIVECYSDIEYCVDNNSDKWGDFITKNIRCMNPANLLTESNVFVLIMIQNPNVIAQIIHQLLDMGITDFDLFDNWIKYRGIGVIKNTL